jgi:hypothetical protein
VPGSYLHLEVALNRKIPARNLDLLKVVAAPKQRLARCHSVRRGRVVQEAEGPAGTQELQQTTE